MVGERGHAILKATGIEAAKVSPLVTLWGWVTSMELWTTAIGLVSGVVGLVYLLLLVYAQLATAEVVPPLKVLLGIKPKAQQAPVIPREHG